VSLASELSLVVQSPHPYLPGELPARAAAFEVLSRLRGWPGAGGYTAYFAGGCVRDELLGREPEDYDVVTTATPAEIEKVFGGKYASHVGAHFGVMVVRTQGQMIEVATFRRDGEYTDFRRPDSVVFSDPAQDAGRRDFTVNALFLDPLARGAGAGPGGIIIDYVGGLADMTAGVLRAVGDPHLRLAEDHLRALRGARLAAKLGFTIEPATAAAIKVHSGGLAGVSRERIGDELRRMLAHPSRAQAAEHLLALGLLSPALLLGELRLPGWESEVSGDGSGDGGGGGSGGGRWLHLRGLEADAGSDSSLAAVWCALALDLGTVPTAAGAAELTTRLRRAVCLTNEEQAGIRQALATLEELENGYLALSEARQKRIAARWKFRDALTLLRIRNNNLGTAVSARVEVLAARHGGVAPPPMITGDELILMGLKPGPVFKALLEHLYDAQLEGEITSVEQAHGLAMEEMRRV